MIQDNNLSWLFIITKTITCYSQETETFDVCLGRRPKQFPDLRKTQSEYISFIQIWICGGNAEFSVATKSCPMKAIVQWSREKCQGMDVLIQMEVAQKL